MHIISTIESKGGEFDPFSSRFDMKTMRKADQIWDKMRSNIGATSLPFTYMFDIFFFIKPSIPL